MGFFLRISLQTRTFEILTKTLGSSNSPLIVVNNFALRLDSKMASFFVGFHLDGFVDFDFETFFTSKDLKAGANLINLFTP